MTYVPAHRLFPTSWLFSEHLEMCPSPKSHFPLSLAYVVANDMQVEFIE